MTENKITPYRDKFSTIPNIVDDMGLSPYAVRLYLRIRRRAGESGACWENTQNLAAGCQMSAGSVSKAKQELKQAGLIHIESKENPNGGKPYHEISIVDIWQLNAHYYPNSGDELAISPDELASSPSEPKKNPLRKATGEKEKASRSSPLYPPQAEKTSACDGLDSSPADSSHNHPPAIQAVKQVSGYYPKKQLWEPVINLLGDKPDIERMRRVFTLWTAKGHNPQNLNGWLFDWYPTDAHYTNPADRAVLDYLQGEE